LNRSRDIVKILEVVEKWSFTDPPLIAPSLIYLKYVRSG
jgi:hypothetical protein